MEKTMPKKIQAPRCINCRCVETSHHGSNKLCPGGQGKTFTLKPTVAASTKTFEEWLKLVKSYTKYLTQADAEAVARLCVTNPTWGVWHAHAQHYGTQCWCADCRPDIKRFH